MDLGAGHGAAVGELVRRSRGPVVAIDKRKEALSAYANSEETSFDGALRVVADGETLPFPDGIFSLVHGQLVLMWQPRPEDLVAEIARVLEPGGVCISIEPDYGGMMEWPPGVALRGIWIEALNRVGADPLIGRKLPAIFAGEGLQAKVDLLGATSASDPDRFELLDGLPLTSEERAIVDNAREEDSSCSNEQSFIHLPYVFITGTRL